MTRPDPTRPVVDPTHGQAKYWVQLCVRLSVRHTMTFSLLQRKILTFNIKIASPEMIWGIIWKETGVLADCKHLVQ